MTENAPKGHFLYDPHYYSYKKYYPVINTINFLSLHLLHMCSSFSSPFLLLSVNFKKNEKVYNPEKSEVLKALQENDSEPEPGNDDKNDDDNRLRDFLTWKVNAMNNDDNFCTPDNVMEMTMWKLCSHIIIYSGIDMLLINFLTRKRESLEAVGRENINFWKIFESRLCL